MDPRFLAVCAFTRDRRPSHHASSRRTTTIGPRKSSQNTYPLRRVEPKVPSIKLQAPSSSRRYGRHQHWRF